MPGVRRRSAPLTIDSSALPGADPGRDLPRRAAARRPYRLILTADGFATHVKLAGLGRARPADRAADRRLRRPAADPVPGVQPALLRLRARPARDPDPVRHLPGRRPTFVPWDAVLPNQTSTQLLHDRQRARRRALPGRDRARSRPSFDAGSRRQHGRRALARSRSSSAATDGDQNLDRRSTSRRRPASRRRCRASPTARRRRSRRSPAPATPASPSWPPRPARPRARSAPRSTGAGAGSRTRSTRRARSTSPARTRARRSASRRRPGGLRALRPRQRRRPGGAPRRPATRAGHRGLRPAPADPRRHPAARCARSRSTSTGPASPSTRPTATRSRSTRRSIGDEGAQRRPRSTTSRSPTAPTSPSRRSSA